MVCAFLSWHLQPAGTCGQIELESLESIVGDAFSRFLACLEGGSLSRSTALVLSYISLTGLDHVHLHVEDEKLSLTITSTSGITSTATITTTNQTVSSRVMSLTAAA